MTTRRQRPTCEWEYADGDVIVNIGNPDKWVVTGFDVFRGGYVLRRALSNLWGTMPSWIAKDKCEDVYVRVGEWDFRLGKEVDPPNEDDEFSVGDVVARRGEGRLFVVVTVPNVDCINYELQEIDKDGNDLGTCRVVHKYGVEREFVKVGRAHRPIDKRRSTVV